MGTYHPRSIPISSPLKPGSFGRKLSAMFVPDGKVLVGGGFTTFNGSKATKLVRLLGNGLQDVTFNAGTIPGSPSVAVRSLALNSLGQVFTGGNFNTIAGSSRPGFAKLSSNGSLVASFPATGVTNLYPHSINIQPDGKLLLGTFASAKRLNADGTADVGYVTYIVTGGPLTPNVDQVLLQADGKALMYGEFTHYNGVQVYRYGIARLNTNGSLDNSFQPAHRGFIALQPDGRIIAEGGAVRLPALHTRDTSYRTTRRRMPVAPRSSVMRTR